MKLLQKAGYTVAEVLLVSSMITSISAGTYVVAKKKAKEAICKINLHKIQNAFTLFLIENEDKLPDAVFYPKDMSSKKAIHNILKSYIGKDVFVCPSLPEKLQARGLTYIWNDTYSGKMRDRVRDADKKWLMTEMTAVAKDIPPPHTRGYAILYVDGHVEYSDKPPKFAFDKSWYTPAEAIKYVCNMLWPYAFNLLWNG